MVYQMDPNPNQWQTISFDLGSNAATLAITIDGQVVDPPVGLDNLYRVQKGADVFAPQALRGYWENDSTLFVQQLYMGELNDAEFQVLLSTEEVSLIGKRLLDNLEVKMHGVRIVQ
jgi:hypothetical protein